MKQWHNFTMHKLQRRLDQYVIASLCNVATEKLWRYIDEELIETFDVSLCLRQQSAVWSVVSVVSHEMLG